MYVPWKKNNFLNALGISYGGIYIEGCEPFHVVDIQTAEATLKRAVDKGRLEPDEAAAILDQLRAAGVNPTLKAMFAQAAQVEVPEGFVPSFQFGPHEGCAVPLPHGCIKGESMKSGVISTLIEATDFLSRAVNCKDPIHVLDAVHLIKQMIAAGLPVNEDDAKVQYAALPQDVRDKLEQDVVRDLVGSIPGLGDVLMVMEIGLPTRRRAQQPDQ